MELLKVPILELMELWGELIEAYHGVNGYGGDTAELYAYRFQQYSPWGHGEKDEAKLREIAQSSAHKLRELCALFAAEHDCRVYVDGHPYQTAPACCNAFVHRAHVRVDE